MPFQILYITLCLMLGSTLMTLHKVLINLYVTNSLAHPVIIGIASGLSFVAVL